MGFLEASPNSPNVEGKSAFLKAPHKTVSRASERTKERGERERGKKKAMMATVTVMASGFGFSWWAAAASTGKKQASSSSYNR